LTSASGDQFYDKINDHLEAIASRLASLRQYAGHRAAQ
jgi:hypothetical protein